MLISYLVLTWQKYLDSQGSQDGHMFTFGHTSFALFAKATRIPRLTPLKYLFFGVFLQTRSIYGAFTPVFKHFPQLFRLLIRYVLLEALYATYLGMVPEVHYWN